MKTVCIYHSIDLDGWMSAAIVKHWFKTNFSSNSIRNINIEKTSFGIATIDYSNSDRIEFLDFIDYNYGQPIPDLSKYDRVIMCDISFPKEEMENIAKSGIGISNFIWIDHHISAIKDVSETHFAKTFQGLRNIKFAACELTWKYFFPNEPMPEIVRLLGRYDCFGYKSKWKAIEGYEDIYEVSNHGKVRSIDRVITENNTEKVKNLQGKELSSVISKRGYLVVNLFKNNNGQMRNVHDLVAKAFVPNPGNKATVNHKDSNRLNCYDYNLEWNSYSENNNHSISNGDRGYPVSQYTEEDDFVQTYNSIIIAENETGISRQNIGSVCKGKRISAGGFRWEYDTRKSTSQFIPKDEEQRVLEFQYGARQCICNYKDAYEYLQLSLQLKNDAIPLEHTIWFEGKSIYKYLCTEAKQVYNTKFDLVFKLPVPDAAIYGSNYTNVKFAAINRERFNPINFGIDYHKDGYNGCACFHRTSEGKWAFSLYNDNEKVDCSIIAKQFGGGGHKGAAGMVLTNEQFFKLI